jgi:predicted phage-related endonuclease
MRIKMQGIADSCDRRAFIGGSDARIIMGSDADQLLQLWQEKRGEVEPEDLSGNLIVQLGTVTERLNRHWVREEYWTSRYGRPAAGFP